MCCGFYTDFWEADGTVIPSKSANSEQDYVDFGLDFNTLEHFKQDLVLHES